MSKFKASPFSKDIKRLIALVKSGKATDEDKKLLAKLREKERSNTTEAPKRSGVPGNDFSWWNKVPELLQDAANLKSNWVAGTHLAGPDLPFTPVGAVRIDYKQMYGASRTATDPLNVWARDLYLKMFQKWRGISSYSQSDLGIAIIAECEIIRMVAKLERIYGIVNRYNVLNLNMPYTEVGALGLTLAQADYIRGHLSDFRYDLNELIRKAQRLCLPLDLSCVSDMVSLCGFEYMDHDNMKAQIIIFDTEEFGVYSDIALSTGGSITFCAPNGTGPLSGVPLIDTSGSSNNMFPALSTMIDNLLGSTSIQRIFGDLLTWFGEQQMLQLQPLVSDYIIAPVYSESILHKMHNLETPMTSMAIAAARHAGLTSADDTAIGVGNYWIYQYNDTIIAAPYIFSPSGTLGDITVDGFKYKASTAQLYTIIHYDGPSVIDTYRVDPTDETITEGVLLKFNVRQASGLVSGTTYYTGIFESIAFELVTKITLFTVDQSALNLYASSVVYGANMSANTALTNAGTLAVLDWAPLSYYCSGGAYRGVYGDIDTPIPVYPNTMQKLHRAIVYSGLHTEIRVLDSHSHN